jgi:FkbM family methyltransferase
LAALGTRQPWGYYAKLTGVYRRESVSARDLVNLLRVRLALSKAGRLACPRPITVSVNLHSFGAVVLRSHTTDISVLGELIVENTYQPFLDLGAGPVRTIVDLGANTGLAARWFERSFPGAQIVCVEPEPGNVDALRSNLEGIARSQVVAACVGGRRREVSLDMSGGEFAVTMLESQEPGSVRVPVLTMEDVISNAGVSHIDLLKCDIEGAEEELFASCRGWIGSVDAIVVECHGAYGVEQLLGDLSANGADFEVRHRAANPAFDNEVAMLTAV